ncbi:MAG TPA: hypothetical protein VEY95_05645 [Azospirillaceae bacterium]|nr:hypothetical protein [Azospirillaceae bacterium]
MPIPFGRFALAGFALTLAAAGGAQAQSESLGQIPSSPVADVPVQADTAPSAETIPMDPAPPVIVAEAGAVDSGDPVPDEPVRQVAEPTNEHPPEVQPHLAAAPANAEAPPVAVPLVAPSGALPPDAMVLPAVETFRPSAPGDDDQPLLRRDARPGRADEGAQPFRFTLFSSMPAVEPGRGSDGARRPVTETPLFDRDLPDRPPWLEGRFLGDPKANRLTFTAQLGPQANLNVAAGPDPALQFGLPGSGALAGSAPLLRDGFATPYIKLFAGGTGALVSGRTGGLRWRLGALTALSMGDGGPPQRTGGFGEVSFRSFGATFGLQAGMITEQGTVLGAGNVAGQEIDGTSVTWMLGGFAVVPVTPRLSLLAGYQSAWSSVPGGALRDGTSLDGLRSEGFAFGLVGSGLFTEQDRLVMAVSRPIRFTAGSSLSVGADGSYSRISAAPDAAAMSFELAYRLPLLGGRHSFVARAGFDLAPGNDANAAPVGFWGLRYRLAL